MNVRLRAVTQHDVELVRSWKRLPELREFAEDESDRPGEIIEVDGQPVGWIDPHPAYAPAWQQTLGPQVGDRPWTVDVFVLPERWGRGIARGAIRSVSERCLADGATSMVVDVARNNDASRAAFEGAGWQLLDTNDEEFLLTYPPRDR